MRHLVVATLVVATLVVGCVDPPRAPPPRRQLTEHELVAIHKLDADDAHARQDALAKKLCDAWHDVRPGAFGTLYGEDPATPGSAFVAPDSPFQVWTFQGAHTARVSDGRRTTCWHLEGQDVYCPFACDDDIERDCMALAGQLREAWGESEHDVWVDRTGTVRASVRARSDCELVFQAYVPPREWIAMTATAEVPLALLGRPAKRLMDRADEGYSPDDDRRFERDLAVTGEHLLLAHLIAVVHADRIVRFEVNGECDEDGGADELHELVRPFRGRLNVQLHTAGTRFELAISE